MKGLLSGSLLLIACTMCPLVAAAQDGWPNGGNSGTTGFANGSFEMWLDVTGYDGSSQPDPQDRPSEKNLFRLTVRDWVNRPVAFAIVSLDFTNCTDLKLCETLLSSCATPIVTLTANAQGQVETPITGAATNFGAPSSSETLPGATGACLRVFAQTSSGGPLVQLTTMKVTVRDQNGAVGGPGVNGVDAAILKSEVLAVAAGGSYRSRSDLDHSGTIAGPDAALIKSYVLSQGSILGCVDGAGTPKSYCP